MKILIAEDEGIPRQLLQFQLEQWGHTVVSVSDGRQAWDFLQTEDCQLVITDWEMPGMSGIELIRRIREVDRASYVYVILLTSKTEQGSLVAGLKTGADDYLLKPVHKDELQARLQPCQRIIELEQRLAERHRELENHNRLLANANSKMKRDLNAAARIQQAFLPSRLQDLPGVQFAWRYSPCSELAGDMLNVMRLNEDHIGVYLLDVSGHGVQAALMAVTACRYLSNHKDASSVLWERHDGDSEYRLRGPAAAAEQLNSRLVAQSLTEQYFTLTYGILNHRTGEFRYAVAGHPPSVRISATGRSEFLRGGGLPIGITATTYDEYSIQLDIGDRLVFYSDGVTESMNASKELFGNSRLLKSLRDSTGHSLDATLSHLLNQIQTWSGQVPFNDDLSLVVLQYEPRLSNFREQSRRCSAVLKSTERCDSEAPHRLVLPREAAPV